MYLPSNTTIWWRYIYIYIYIIYYIQNNYMFRRLIIFMLYMKHLVSSYTKHVYGLLIWGREGVKWESGGDIYIHQIVVLDRTHTPI